MVVNTGGTAAIGTPTAALNVGGNVSFAPGSTYQVQVNPQQQGNVISATGTATLSGGTVQVQPASGSYAPNNTYTILSAAGGLSGAFTGTTSSLAFLTPTLTYDPKNVYLALAPNGTTFAQVASTSNQRAVATALSALGTANPIYDALVSLDKPTARAAFDNLSGEIHASAKSVLLDDSHYIRDAVLDRTRQGLAPASGPLAALASGAASCDNDALDERQDKQQDDAATRTRSHNDCSVKPRLTPVVWGQAYGSQGRLGSDGNAASVDRSSTGFVVGADTALNDTWRVGAAGGIGHTSFDTSQSNASSSIDSYHLALYGGAQFGALGLRLGSAYTWNRVHAVRSASFAGFTDNPSSAYDAGTAQVFGEAGYAIPVGRVALEPFAGLAYVNLHTDGFTEEGGAAALHSGNDTQNLTYSTLGVRAASRFDLSGTTVITPRAMVGWRHAFGNVTPTSSLAFAGSATAFTVSGVPIARDSAVVELGLDVSVGKNATVGVSYSGQYGGGYRDNAIQGNLLWRF